MEYKFEDPALALANAQTLINKALISRTTELDLSKLGLTKVPPSIRRLKNLQTLYLHDNRLTEWPESLRELNGLRLLNVGLNQLTTISESLGDLAALEDLYLGGNKLLALPDSLGRLHELRHLKIWTNELTVLPDVFHGLTKLRLLQLEENQLTSLPESLGGLASLQYLVLEENKLEALPESLRKLTGLQGLYLHGNEKLGLPPEVLGPNFEEGRSKQRWSRPLDILDYYFRTRGGARPLNEGKVILLGRGEVGKTALVNRLVRDEFKRTSMTRGISITQWPVNLGKETIRLNIWDFGGQEIQHATHQFFLTERSLYLVVLNGRAGAEDEDAEYWLKFVKTFGGSSPTIVVLNKFKVQPFEVNRRALCEKYPFIRAFVETDCKPKTKNGRPELVKQIKSALSELEYVRADFPADWFRIKERLAKMQELGESFISFDEYRKICDELGEKDAEAQERLAGFLNALGIALNFREDQQLREETVLNPHWITEGVYQIITSELLAESKGELQTDDLAAVFKKKQKDYPPRMHGFLIELMRKFELCFPYHDDPREQRYLVPELLGKEKPELNEPFPPNECLNFRYDYRLMPEGLLPRFITRTHTMSESAERWRTGVVLHWEGCRALVEADKQERQVFVRVVGEPEKRRRLLAVIRENFDQIHVEMKEFRPTQWVALEGHPDEWLDCEELEVFEQQKEATIRKRVGKEVLSVNVSKVLDGTDVPGVREGLEGKGMARRLKLFISYAHLDEKWRVILKPNLELLQREGLIEIWSDRQIIAGTKWDEEIQRKVESADLYLFLMSTNLLNSDYIQKKELPAALQRYKKKKAGFVPIIVQRCSWQNYVGEIQGLPSGGRPISDWRPYDRACFDVEEGLRKTIEEVRRLVGK